MEASEPRTLAAVPAKYIVNAALRDIRRATTGKGDPDFWVRHVERMVEEGRTSGDALERIMRERMPQAAVVDITRTDARRSGKPTTTIDVMLMRPETLVQRDNPLDTPRDVVILRRNTLVTRSNEVEMRGSPCGIGVDRHVLERLHEREGCTHETIGQRLKTDMADIASTISFAMAAGLVKRPMHAKDARDAPVHLPGTATQVPFGDGLLVTTSMQIDIQDGHRVCGRNVLRRRDTQTTYTRTHPDRRVPTDDIDGRPAEGHLITLGITYLSFDMLRPDQRDYQAIFQDEMERHDLKALTADIGRTWMPHETPTPPPRIEVTERLHRLLNENVRRNDRSPRWMVKPEK